MPDNSTQPSNCSYGLILWGAAAYILIKSFPLLSPILLALLLIILLSLALNPLVAALRRLFGGRSRATAFVILFFVAVFGLTAWGFYRPVKKSTKDFVARLPQYWERIQKPLLKLEQRAAASQEKVHREAATELKQEIARTNQQPAADVKAAVGPQPPPQNSMQTGGILESGMSHLFGGITGTFKTVASNTLEMFTIALTVFVGVIFTLLNPRSLVGFTFSMIPERHHPKTAIVLRRIIEVIPQWALATVFGMAAIGSMTFVAMWPLLGFQDALVLGLLAFVFEAVPYIGPMLSVVPAVLLALSKGGWTPLWVVMAYAMIQMIENHFIVPRVVAGRLKLHPIAAMFSVLLCVTIFGVFGIILAIPLVAVANILHEEIFRPRFLPHVSDEELDHLARTTLNEKAAVKRVNLKRIRPRRFLKKHRTESPPGSN